MTLIKKYIKILFKIHIKISHRKQKMNYITGNDTIMFNSVFNEKIDTELISNYKKLIFSDYTLDKQLFEHYSNNNFEGLTYKRNKFNQDVSNLPQGITHLTFGGCFNQDVSNYLKV